MLLVARSTRATLHDVRFMECVLHMTRLAFTIDRLESDAVTKSIAHNHRQFSSGRSFVVTGGAIVREACVRRGNFPGVEKRFAPVTLKNDDGDEAADDRD